MQMHILKIEDRHYENIMTGDKKFEIRYNDRDYQKGDTIKFQDVSGISQKQGLWVITHVHSGYGMADNFVALAIASL